MLWKLSTAVLALTTVAGVAVPWKHGSTTAVSKDEIARRANDLSRPLRVSALAVGLDEDQLLADLEHAGAPQVIIILDKLREVGSERAVPVIARLVDDRRAGVAEGAIAALGGIGGDDAGELLISLTDDPRLRLRAP